MATTCRLCWFVAACCLMALMGWLPDVSGQTPEPHSQNGQLSVSEEKTQPTNSVNNQSQSTVEFAFPVRVVNDPADAAEALNRQIRDEKRSESDLQAQWRAADAAYRAADIAEWGKAPIWGQLALNAVSVLLLALTLYEARKTTNAALSGTAIARQDLQHTRQTDRPFIHPVSGSLEQRDTGHPLYFAKINFINNGTSMGIIRSINAYSVVNDIKIYHSASVSPPAFTPMKPGEETEIANGIILLKIDPVQYKSLRDGENMLYLYATISYSRLTRIVGWCTEFKFKFCPAQNGGELRWDFAHWYEGAENCAENERART